MGVAAPQLRASNGNTDKVHFSNDTARPHTELKGDLNHIRRRDLRVPAGRSTTTELPRSVNARGGSSWSRPPSIRATSATLRLIGFHRPQDGEAGSSSANGVQHPAYHADT